MSRMQLAGIGFQAALGHNLGTQYVRDFVACDSPRLEKINGLLKRVGVIAASLKSPFYLISKYVYSQKCYGVQFNFVLTEKYV